jgi:hypothetical protein
MYARCLPISHEAFPVVQNEINFAFPDITPELYKKIVKCRSRSTGKLHTNEHSVPPTSSEERRQLEP